MVGTSGTRARLGCLPMDVRRAVGGAIGSLQFEEVPRDWKPMPTVGPGVREIRLHSPAPVRIIYLLIPSDRLLVLNVFIKKSSKTPRHELELARRNLTALLWQRP